MSDKTNKRIEREARESLVAADLSAKMKQWRDQPPPPGGGGNGSGSRLRLLLVLLVFGGAAWWLWPKSESKGPTPAATPNDQSAPIPAPATPIQPQLQQQKPMAQKPAGNRYLALALSNYKAPDFTADIRGVSPGAQDVLNDARQALHDHRPANALDALQHVSKEYQTDADYLRAHALFDLKKYNQSAVLFGQLTSSVRYGEAAEWYEILALLPGYEQNKSLIISRLKKIAGDDGHTFQPEAKKLIQAL